MIQRIQTLYLLLTVVITGLLFIMPMAILNVPNEFAYEFYTLKVIRLSNPSEYIACNWMSMILNILITGLAFVSIFLYKKRLLQMRMCFVNIVLMLGMLILMWAQIHYMAGEVHAGWLPAISFCFPFVGIILTWQSIRGIIKDLSLLKSYDRIR